MSRINSKEEYPSSARMNISRIYHLGNEEGYLLPIRVNVSRIKCQGETRITTIGYWVEYQR